MKNLNFLTDLRNSNQVMTRLRPGNNQVKTTLRFFAVLCLLMTIGVGNAWGETETYSYSDYTGQGTPSSGSSYTMTKTYSSIGDTKFNGGASYGQFFAGGVTTITPLSSATITRVVLTAASSSYNGYQSSGTVTASAGTVTKTNNTTVTWTGSQTTAFTISHNKQIRWTSIVVTYTAAASYTVTATRNDNSYGTVSVSGTTITATPSACYQVISGAGGYTVTSGTATVSHTGTSNTLTVTPSTNCTVQVNFEKQTVNTYVDEIQGNSDIEDCGTHDAPSLDDEDEATSGTCAQQHWKFMGWVTAANKANPTDANIITPGTEMTANGTTYYAVWAKGTGGGGFDGEHGGTFKIYADVSGTKYYATSTISSGKFGRTTTASDAAEFTITPITGGFTIKLGDNFVYYTGSTNLGTQNSSYTWTFASGVKGTWRANSATSGRGFIYRDGTGFGGYSTGNVTAGGTEYYDVEIGGGYEYSDYMCTCCTNLGSVTGVVSRTVPGSATLTWSDVTGAEKYQVKVPGSSSHDGWTDATSGVSVTGLTCGTAYTAYFRAIDTNGSHCSTGPESTTAVPAVSWTVTSTGVTNATASPAIPSTTCSGFSTTISPATGYALPADITVTNATKSWNSSTGALSISSVTGNVSITITPTCVSPVVTADPEDADYFIGDSPDALSVTATLASGTRTYLWKVSTNGGSTWSDATGTNNTASYSGASLSTASAGTLKFKCIVGNSQGGCTVESGVATITVSSASYFPNGKTIFIQAHSTSAWTGGGCVKAWFHTSGGSETAQPTYWLFDATGDDSGKKLFAAVVPASGDLPYLDIQRFASNCSDWWNKNGGCSYSDANGSNTIRSTGKHDDSSDGDYIRWNNSGVTMELHGDPSGDEWASKLADVTDQGGGVWSGTYEDYAPADADGTSQDFKIKTNYNGWIGNTGSNNNATLDGMKVGSTYNITASLNVTTHALTMSKTFVKGTVHFDLQGHGLAISDYTDVTAGSKISAPDEPSATGYTFGGWFTDAECTDEWTFASDVVNETMTLYAKWTANVYTITKTFTNVANAGLPSSFTYTGSATTALNSTFTVNTTNFFLPSSIAVTMGGTPLTAGTDYTYNNSTGAFTFGKIINGNIVITATATAKLKSIAITTQPTTRKYFAGESFSSTGAVVTATMGAGTKTVSATWTPSGALSAGTSQTVTASYTENGITKTATTTIDVYAVTMQATDENGDAIAVGGPGAPTRSIKSISPAADAANYVFKQWTISGASLGSSATTKSNTITSPTGAVTVTAVYYKPRVVKWSVNGNDSYNTGSPTTTVAYNGTISTVPTNPSGLACASTFVAWTDAAHNNGTTAKDNASYYGSALYTAAGDFPNITAATTTFYAVFAEGGEAAVNTTMWSENWTGVTSGKKPSEYDGTGRAVYNSGTVTYTESGSNCNVKAESYAGGSSPELYIKGGEWWNIANIPTGGAATLTLTYMSNNDADVTTTTKNVAVGTTSSSGNSRSRTITISGDVSYFDLKFAKSSNTRVDNVLLKVASVSLTNYVTECDANIVSVTYDANGGSTSCTNTTTDKTEDYTVCSTPPTRDYYTFAGWLCSADDEVYAANATIDDAVIDADFTLTAQWNPVTYNITYNLYGGTNSGSNPATYNVTTATITLQDPTKGHDRFEGWYSTYSAGVYSDQVTSISLGSHGDITLHAKWAARHEIIFDADGTKTPIYRADDEDLSASVAGQGSVPSDPSAPTACSSKVFVGWSESTIDGETDDEPGDLMKPAAGTVNADKHYYAVWATESSESGTVYLYNGSFEQVTSGTEYGDKGKWTTSKVYGTGTAGEVRMSSSGAAGSMDLDLSDKTLATTITVTFKMKRYGTETGSVTLSCMDDGSTASFGSSPFSYPTGDDNWHDCSSTVTSVNNAKTNSIHFTSTSGKRVYVKDVVVSQIGTIYNYSAYSTSCCATKVTLSQNSPEHGTIAFGKTKVPTCGGDKEVSLTITPAAGYQLHSYEVATGSGKVGTKSVSPAISLDNNSSAAQNITLTFADEAHGAYDVTASFSLMTVTSWTWTMHDGGGAIPDPLNLYVGQNARLDVAYTPAGVDASKKTYTRNKDNAYINWVGSAYAGYSTISGRATTGENTTAVTFTHADGPTKTVNVKVLPLPLTHFADLVHGKAFADVAATIVENALSATKNTPTSDDWVTPNANSCEENHLHLVGWIREDWPALVAYLNGTGAAPTTVAITGAGNDGAGHAYYIAAGASINVQTFDGVTFYAVWSKVE